MLGALCKDENVALELLHLDPVRELDDGSIGDIGNHSAPRLEGG